MDEADCKILYHLDLNSRCPVKKLANLTGIKPEKIEERIKHFHNEGIIRRCYPELNRAKLGCIPFKIYLQFQDISPDKLDQLYDYLSKMRNVGWVALCSGTWDMIIAVFSKNVQDFYHVYDSFLAQYHNHVLKKMTAITVDYYISNKAWLCKDATRSTVAKAGGAPENIIDETDSRILHYLGKNGRAPVLEIANDLEMDANEVEARLKALQEKGVILSFQIDVEPAKIDRVFCKSFIYLTKSTKREEDRLLEYCFRHPEITTILRCVGPWDLEIEAFSGSFKAFTEMMNDIRNRYSCIVRNFEAVVINKDSGTMFLPDRK